MSKKNKDKKMTKKQFIEIFEKAGMSFDIWGFEGILNYVIMGNRYMEKDEIAHGNDKMANVYSKRAKIIFSELEKIGYFTYNH